MDACFVYQLSFDCVFTYMGIDSESAAVKNVSGPLIVFHECSEPLGLPAESKMDHVHPEGHIGQGNRQANRA